jgi:two-component system, NarL family, nitrate/nitrite response regulator NarL
LAAFKNKMNFPIRILLVDDSVEFLKSASALLGREPRVQVIGQALSGQEALDLVIRLQPDLILMDLTMPTMNGLEATRAIRKLPDAPPVVILTLHDNQEYVVAARDSGAVGFISKADFTKDFVALIEDLLKRIEPESLPA